MRLDFVGCRSGCISLRSFAGWMIVMRLAVTLAVLALCAAMKGCWPSLSVWGVGGSFSLLDMP